MMDCTDRHQRYFMRLVTRRTLLYTEMITTGALLHGDRVRFLAFDPLEHPVAIQLGGCDPGALAASAELAELAGYDEVNLNAGCPSPRVKEGSFGACLMAEPLLVARCISAMHQAISLPITIKTRIGIDEQDQYARLRSFVARVIDAGCARIIVHARKAWLNGLSPKQNREIPPLRYDVVYRLKEDFPDMPIVINGGITTLDGIDTHLHYVDGVMIGREAYRNPFILSSADRRFFNDYTPPRTREEVIDALHPYITRQLQQGVRLSNITRHTLGLYHHVGGARAWRRHISEHAGESDPALLHDALQKIHYKLAS